MTDLDTLFSKDPLQLTDRDLDTLIAHYRTEHAQFKIEESTGKSQKGKKKASPSASVQLDLVELKNLKLDDL